MAYGVGEFTLYGNKCNVLVLDDAIMKVRLDYGLVEVYTLLNGA